MEKLQELILELEKSIEIDGRPSDSPSEKERVRFLTLWLGPWQERD